MVLTENEKKIRELERQIISLREEITHLKGDYIVKKQICSYQENLINKLLNTIQQKTIETNYNLERGY